MLLILRIYCLDRSKRKGRTIVLKKKLGEMRKRTFPCIMRYHKGSRLKDPEHYFFTLLQLYMPWRNESDLKQGFLSYEDKFNHIETALLPNISHHDVFMEFMMMKI